MLTWKFLGEEMEMILRRVGPDEMLVTYWLVWFMVSLAHIGSAYLF
jgi:hypothetical protein